MGSGKEITHEQMVAIVTLYNAGHTVREISEYSGVKIRSVQRWLKRYRETGDAAILPVPRPRPGRPKVVSPRTVNILKRQVERSPRKNARQVKLENPRLLGDVSLRTVQRRLHDDVGVRRYKSRRKPLVTLVQRGKRVAFARKYGGWDINRWRKVLWSDESTFTVTGNRAGYVYRRPGSDPLDPKYLAPTVKWPDSIMVWGCFSYFGVGELVVLNRNVTMNQYNYYELLNDNLPAAFDKCKANYFMQDGAPCHTAKSVRKWLDDCCVDYFMDWPGNSPDINPIENLWGLIKKELEGCDTSSVKKLEAAVRQVWNDFPADKLHNLADSVPNRLREIIKHKGRPTRF